MFLHSHQGMITMTCVPFVWMNTKMVKGCEYFLANMVGIS